MKSLQILLVLGVLFTAPMMAMGCSSRSTPDAVEVKRWALADAPTSSNLKHTMIIGSVHAYWVPKGVSAQIHPIQQGMATPAVVLSDEQVNKAKHRFKYTGDQAPDSRMRNKKWLYINGESHGKGEWQITDSNGWHQRIELGMVHRQAQPTGEPIGIEPSDGEKTASFEVSANHNTVWVSVLGSIADK